MLGPGSTRERVVRKVDFSRYGYVPSILADAVGEEAYERLTADTKAGILALFELCWRSRAQDFTDCLRFLARVEGLHPYLLDIDKRSAPEPYFPANPKDPAAAKRRYAVEKLARDSYNAELKKLLRPEDGFFRWRELVSRFPNSVPVLQVANVRRDRENVLRQAESLCVGGASAAFRIRESRVEGLCSLAAEILLALPDPAQLLLIFDCGQSRVRVAERAAFVRWAFGNIQKQLGVRSNALRAVCMSNSFTQPAHKGTRFKESLDQDLWRRATPTRSMAYGDYAAYERSESHSSYRPWDYRAAITHSLPEGWLICRDANKNDPAGWCEGCRRISDDARFRPLRSWCDQVITETARAGKCQVEEPRFWHATRVNGHIERQHQYTRQRLRRAA